MGKIAKAGMVMVVVAAFISGAVYAASGTPAGQTKGQKPAVVEVGNKICPVTGDKVSGNDLYDYNGKRYGLCCSMCLATFANNPAKYAAIADKEVAKK